MLLILMTAGKDLIESMSTGAVARLAMFWIARRETFDFMCASFPAGCVNNKNHLNS